MDEVSKELGRKLELVDTGGPETYIEQDANDFDIKENVFLRIAAKKLGADAIVHYKRYPRPYQRHFLMGTLVRFVDENEGDGK